ALYVVPRTMRCVDAQRLGSVATHATPQSMRRGIRGTTRASTVRNVPFPRGPRMTTSVRSWLNSLFAAPDGAAPRTGLGYSDVILAFGAVLIISVMILPLPLFVIDALVAVNISIGFGLLLLGIYIPNPVAFSSFPSVLLLTTLFRLAISIAITKSILLHADGGHIVETFGTLVAGNNLVVGLVVFLIITVVQFIVIAKGSERVAEVAARFTLDAMPGKQLSIDSDLRSGMLDKDEA